MVCNIDTFLYHSTLLLSYVRLERVQPLIIYFIFLSIFWCLFRIVVLNNSIESVNYHHLLSFDLTDMAWTVCMITISSIFLVFGIALGAYKGSTSLKFKTPLISSRVNTKFLISYFLLIMLWMLVIRNFYNDPAFAGPTLDKPLAVLNMVLSDFPFIFLVTGLIIYRPNITLQLKILLISLTIIYVLALMLLGSRAGTYWVFIAYGVAILAYNYRYKFKVKYLTLFIFVLIISLLLYVVSSELRQISISLTRAGDYSTFKLITGLWEAKDELSSNFDLGYWLNAFSRRISMFDYLNVFFNGTMVTDHLRFTYGFKSLWNVLMPSIVGFNDAILFQSNLFQVACGHNTYEMALTNYHSDMLPLFGILYVNFSFFSLICISFFGYISARGYIWIDYFDLKESFFLKDYTFIFSVIFFLVWVLSQQFKTYYFIL